VKLENSFEVPAPPEAAWALLIDVPRIIPLRLGLGALWRTLGRLFRG
jgi:carbon monoxide dehydrogenase subunit G